MMEDNQIEHRCTATAAQQDGLAWKAGPTKARLLAIHHIEILGVGFVEDSVKIHRIETAMAYSTRILRSLHPYHSETILPS